MQEITNDAETDQLIWSIIKESKNSKDFIDFIRQAMDRESDFETAFELMEKFWQNPDSESIWPQVVRELERFAEEGSSQAMFRLGILYRNGYGVEQDSENGMAWYKQGIELFDPRCFMGYGISISNSDPETAKALFQRAVELGYLKAHIYWADVDKTNYMSHMAKGAESRDPQALYCYGYDCLMLAKSDEEKARAFKIIREAAELGSAAACLQIGLAYYYGSDGHNLDLEASELWLIKGSKLGNERCLSTLGTMLLRYFPERSLEAVKYLLRSSLLNDKFGQYALGFHLLWESQSESDLSLGLRWLKVSADNKYSSAYYQLGEAYRMGRGVEPDQKAAAEWYRLGADAGVADCQCAFGIANLYGHGIPIDEDQAHNLFQTASLQDSDWGLYLLGQTYEYGYGTSKDLIKAFECYKQGAGRNYPKSCYAVGLAYLYGEGVAVNYSASARWFKVASDLGNDNAKVYLGLFFLNGTGVKENFSKALYWLKSAAEGGCSIAMRELGLIYFKGEKAPIDMIEAQRWMGQAAANGDDQAIQWIEKNCPEKPQWLNTLLLKSNKSHEEPKDI